MVTGSNENKEKYEDELKKEKTQKSVLAASSSLLAAVLFFSNPLHMQGPSSVALLHTMAKDSENINVAMCNSKPTIIEFYADWCESCKVMAPTMRSLELFYAKQVNFVTLDGTASVNADLVSKFKVDGIPHIAFLDAKDEIKTSLVGAVPRQIMKDEIEALLKGTELPYLGYDSFEKESSRFPLGDIASTCSYLPEQ